jgi:hypothetical protein
MTETNVVPIVTKTILMQVHFFDSAGNRAAGLVNVPVTGDAIPAEVAEAMVMDVNAKGFVRLQGPQGTMLFVPEQQITSLVAHVIDAQPEEKVVDATIEADALAPTVPGMPSVI